MDKRLQAPNSRRINSLSASFQCGMGGNPANLKAQKGQTLPYMFYCICLPHIISPAAIPPRTSQPQAIRFNSSLRIPFIHPGTIINCPANSRLTSRWCQCKSYAYEHSLGNWYYLSSRILRLYVYVPSFVEETFIFLAFKALHTTG